MYIKEREEDICKQESRKATAAAAATDASLCK